jgi:hypothetical protein
MKIDRIPAHINTLLLIKFYKNNTTHKDNNFSQIMPSITLKQRKQAIKHEN